MVTSIDLTTPASSFPRQKYFGIPFYAAGCLPNTTYDAYLDGTLWNAFCRPQGGVLGSPLISGQNGKIIFTMHLQVKYLQSYLVPPLQSNSNILIKTHTVQLIDPFNNSSTISIPITLKAGSL